MNKNLPVWITQDKKILITKNPYQQILRNFGSLKPNPIFVLLLYHVNLIKN